MKTQRHFSFFDKLIIESDRILRTLVQPETPPAKVSPAKSVDETELPPSERKHAAGLMRVNHTGEVCAQALYQGQALTAKTAGTRVEMEEAAQRRLRIESDLRKALANEEFELYY